LAAFRSYADDHNIWEQAAGLSIVVSSMPPQADKDRYDAIDRDVARGMLHAKKMAKRTTGKYSCWLPKLREAGLIARYWNLRLRAAQKGIDLSVPIAQVLKRINSLNIVFDTTVNCTGSGTGTGIEPANGTGYGTGYGNHGSDTGTGNDTGTSMGISSTTGKPADTIEARRKAAIKLLRTVRVTAYDHSAVHLKATLAQYQSLQFSEDQESESDKNKDKIRRIKY
jgi:hypothetical protein